MKLKVLISLLCTTFYACRYEGLQPLDLVKWVENESNGLRSTKKIGSIEYTLQYRPLDYIIATEERGKVSSRIYNNRKMELEGSDYFSLRIKSDEEGTDLLQLNSEEREEYYSREEYVSFNMQHDICLVQGLDTIPCGLCHFVPNYGLSSYIDVLLAFDKSRLNNSDLDLVLYDKLFDSGTLKFHLDRNAITHTPHIITN